MWQTKIGAREPTSGIVSPRSSLLGTSADETTNAGERWFEQWWSEHQSGRSLQKTENCRAFATHFRAFLGSQIFTDLAKIMYYHDPVVRYLNVSRSPYTKNSLKIQDGDSKAVQGLRTCLEERKSGNAIGCLFSPLSTCVPSEPNIERPWPGDPDGPRLAREAALCADSGCVKKLAQVVEVAPRLANATGTPDVSFLALQLFERVRQPMPPLQRAVMETVSKFRSDTGLTGTCVAIHVRRGDKLPECDEGRKSSCAFHMSLEDYLRPATAFLDQLHGGFMFVMTDEPSVLLELDGARKKYRSAGLAGATPSSFDHNDGLLDLVTLLASLDIGSSCSGVVGNSESEVTELLVLASCAKRCSSWQVVRSAVTVRRCIP
jgi:hypothetical protein